MHNYGMRTQYSAQNQHPNQYGSYGNSGSYGHTQPQYQWGTGGGQQHFGGSSYTSQQGYQQPNQYGSYGPGANPGIGTTPTEQMMQGGMGGLSQMMQADRMGSYGPNQSQYGHSGYSQGGYGQQSYGQGGQSNYGGGQQHFGGSSYTSQQGYQQPNQYGSYGPGANPAIGTTHTEQMMQSGMGGLSQVMQADRSSGNYGSSQSQYGQGGYGQSSYGQGSQSNYGGGQQHFGGGSYTSQQGYQQPNQYGSYGPGANPGIGTTHTEQMMQSGMGGLSQVMQADRSSGSYGQGYQQQQSSGQYGSQGGWQAGGSTYNPGDTPLEQQAKQHLGVNSTSTPSNDQ